MKNICVRILLVFLGFVGFSGIAHAEIRDEITVTLPFEFVANGQTLPAGTYTVSRFSDDRLDGVILSNRDKHVSVIVRPNSVGNASADKPSASFEEIGGSRVLVQIETAHDVYTIPPSSAPMIELAKKTGGRAVSQNSGE